MQQKYRRSKMFESTAEPPPPSFPMSVQRPRPHLAIGLCSLPCKNVVKDVPFPQRNTAKNAKVEVKKRWVPQLQLRFQSPYQNTSKYILNRLHVKRFKQKTAHQNSPSWNDADLSSSAATAPNSPVSTRSIRWEIEIFVITRAIGQMEINSVGDEVNILFGKFCRPRTVDSISYHDATCIQTERTHTHTHIQTERQTYAYTDIIYTHIHTHVQTCTHRYIHTHTHIYIYIYT